MKNLNKNKMENKDSQYIKLIKTQEQIIKELKETNWMYFLGGMATGILLANLIFSNYNNKVNHESYIASN